MSSKDAALVKNAEGISRNNLLLMFGTMMNQMMTGQLNPKDLKKEDFGDSLLMKYESSGVDYIELLSMLQKTGLDPWAAEQLLGTVLELLDILSYPEPEPVVLSYFLNRVMQAYAIAVTYSSSESVKTFYRFVSVINEKSTRVDDSVLIDDSFMAKLEEMTRKMTGRGKKKHGDGGD